MIRSVIYFFVVTTSVLAQPLVGSWFSPTGTFRPCLENPGLSCPQTSFGPSEQEKALYAHAFSVLRMGQSGIATIQDSSRKLTDGNGDLDFRMRFSTPLGTSLGLGIAVPYARQRFETDSIDIQTSANTGQATLLLGSDLMSLNGVDEQARHHIFIGFEIPIAYDPGLWESHIEWVWKAGFRARATYWSVSPRQELVSFEQSGPTYKYRWKERITQGLIAGRPLSWLEFGLRGTRSQVDPKGGLGEMDAKGDVWQGAGSLQLLRKQWKFIQSIELQREDLQMAWNENVAKTGSSDTAEPWSMALAQKSDTWVYGSRLQRAIGTWRVSLWGERRFSKGQPNRIQIGEGDSASLSWASLVELDQWKNSSEALGESRTRADMLGAEVRWNADGFFVEPGMGWAKGRLTAQENPWLTWGIPLGLDGDLIRYQAILGSVNAGFSGGGNRFQYSWRQAFLTEGSGFRSGVKTTWGGMHRFTIEGGF